LLENKIGERHNDYLEYLDEVKSLSLLRKGDIFNTTLDGHFYISFAAKNFRDGIKSSDDLQKLDVPVRVDIEHSSDQKIMLSHYFESHERNTIELAWLLNRVPARNMYRGITVADNIGDEPTNLMTLIPEARDTAMGVR